MIISTIFVRDMVVEQSLTTTPMCRQPVSAFTLVRLLVPLMAGCVLGSISHQSNWSLTNTSLTYMDNILKSLTGKFLDRN